MGEENTNKGQIILTAIEGSSTDFPGVEAATSEELADSAVFFNVAINSARRFVC